MALLIRAQLASPDSTLLSQHTYNEMFTMHGSLMIYLFVGPVAFGGLANYIVPLQIGAPDMAFPRLNALSYWLYLGGGSLMMMGFLTTGSARRLRLGGLRTALQLHQHAGCRAGSVDRGPRSSPASRPSSPESTSSAPSTTCVPRG